jgi:hypothetical protein
MSYRLAAIGFSVIAISGCASAAGNPPPVSTLISVPTSKTTFLELQEPPPIYVGGSGLNQDPVGEPDEIDCDEAENLCDVGAYACDDIADYCDIGPDGLGELPDEYDWDGN